MHSPEFTGVVTCTPLDEPVTEGYSILGFPIWWGTRRNGSLDIICKTCYRHFKSPDCLTSETLACGHKNAERVCEMCDCRSCVLHPFPDQENVWKWQLNQTSQMHSSTQVWTDLNGQWHLASTKEQAKSCS
uniref:Uncharacterized protein n=1 Tax=Setaria viridis TaxID=4556 RepID=A0A4U6W0W7_SETVI|nr:hypothetical protein SEVIR_2G380800v2 [Setaria viridis]